MDCPSCKGSTLKPIKLDENLPAWKCPDCAGVLIDMLPYRAWRENWARHDVEALEPTPAPDTSNALLCPKCTRVMLKFKISGKRANRIDVCTNCDEAWLDEGEWELLGALSLQEQLASIFTQPWQRRIRQQEAEELRVQQYIRLIGEDDLGRIDEVATWINAHPERAHLVRILTAKLREGSA